MKDNFKLLAWTLLFVFVVCCKGQDKNKPSEETVKTEPQGATVSVVSGDIPNNITRTIKEDSKGNIWIAAFDGVFRYDGKAFENVTDTVSTARFFSVLEDSKGNFWFASVGSGVYYYDGKSFTNFTTKEGLANDRVIDIYEDESGSVWFGTEGGVSVYDGKRFRNFTVKEGLSNNDVNVIMKDKGGKFWFGTRGAACFYDGNAFTVFTHEGKPFTNVRKIIEDKQGHIWLGGSDGLWRYDSGTFVNISKNFVGYIYEDKDGNIWTSSQSTDDGRWILSRYDRKSLYDVRPVVTEIRSDINPTGMLFGILKAADDRIWYGTLQGIQVYDGISIANFKGERVGAQLYTPQF